jgi:hypothetical protein
MLFHRQQQTLKRKPLFYVDKTLFLFFQIHILEIILPTIIILVKDKL